MALLDAGKSKNGMDRQDLPYVPYAFDRSYGRRGWFALAFWVTIAAPGIAETCRVEIRNPAHVGQDATVKADCPSYAGKRFSWDFGDDSKPSDFSSRPEAVHRYALPGHFTVILRVESDGNLDFADASQTVVHPLTSAAPLRSGTLAHDPIHDRLWVANPDQNTVAALSLANHARLLEVPVGRDPRSLAVDARGRVWVANREDATLSLLDGADGSLLRTVRLPRASRPSALCLEPSGRFIYATLEATGRLLKLSVENGQVLDSLTLFPTARALAVSHDGARILVTRFLSPATHGEVAEVDGGSFRLRRIFRLEADTGPDTESSGRGVPNYLAGVTISPDGREAWVAAKKDNTLRGLARDGRGLTFESSVRAVVLRLDLGSGRERVEGRLDLNDRNLPAAIAFTSWGDYALLASTGSNSVDVREVGAGDPLTSLESQKDTADREPSSVPRALGPLDLWIRSAGSPSDALLFVHYFLTSELGVYDISSLGGENRMRNVALVRTATREILEPQVLRGKQIFYNSSDARMARDGYISCATCHIDGGTDGRVWDFTDRGEGLRRTTSLLGRAGMGMGPVHWSANFDEIQDFEHDMRGPFGGQGFLTDDLFQAGTRGKTLGDRKEGLSPDLDALAAYVASLDRARPSPHRTEDGVLTPEGRDGRDIFFRPDVGCFVCHSGPNFTDSRLPTPAEKKTGANERLKTYAGLPGGALSQVTAEGFVLHDVGTLKPTSGKRMGEALPGLDTPTLLGVWEGGPYLHDGTAATLMDVITTANAGDLHGKTSHLSQGEKERLVAFLQQLEGEGGSSAIRASGPGKEVGRQALGAGLHVRMGGRRFPAGVYIRPTESGLHDISGRQLPPGTGTGGR